VLDRGLKQPEATTVDGSGTIYIADSMNNRLVRLDVPDAPSVADAPTSGSSQPGTKRGNVVP
jgi:sugar lactone lactonase YvrE